MFIGEDYRTQLGEWARHHIKSVAAKEEEAHKRLVDCEIALDELRIHWRSSEQHSSPSVPVHRLVATIYIMYSRQLPWGILISYRK